MKLRVVLFVALLMQFVSLPVKAQNLPEPPTVAGQELVALAGNLKAGGYVIFFRHLDTRQDQEDRQPVDLNDCTAQRNLSDEGKARGKSIGLAFKRARIPIGEVASSPFCRTVETAKIIFGKVTPEASLFFAIALNDEGKKQKGQMLRSMLSKLPAKETNTVIVSHTANLQEAVGLWPKPEGVAYVLRPDGKGGVVAVARVAPDAWSVLLK
jgi:phosphohistidine phosphatase SixA